MEEGYLDFCSTVSLTWKVMLWHFTRGREQERVRGREGEAPKQLNWR